MRPFSHPVIALPLLVVIFAGYSNLAAAASRHLSATGGSLAIDSPCAKEVSIAPDPSLSGRVEVDATADEDGEIAQLVLESAAAAKLWVPGDRCWHPGGEAAFSRTLLITVHVPVGFDLAIGESGDASYRLGNIGGKLMLDASGDIDLQAAHITALALEMSGSGKVDVNKMAGDLKVDISGSGGLHVAHGDVGSMAVEISGSGSVALESGQVGNLAVSSSGDGTVRVGGSVNNATVELSGSGDVTLAKVTGRLTKETSGSGNVQVAQ